MTRKATANMGTQAKELMLTARGPKNPATVSQNTKDELHRIDHSIQVEVFLLLFFFIFISKEKKCFIS
jgi:hypothetical protein